MPATKPVSVFQEILDWSSKLSLWQRDALRRIVCNSEITENDEKELTTLCRSQHGLPSETGTILPARPLTADDLPGFSNGTHQGVALLGISHVENVNALCGKQELAFGASGITIVFGYNGSGKSGYGRILKKACRARRKGDGIMPNVLAGLPTGPASAEIRFSLDGAEQPAEQWIEGSRDIAVLSSVSFFDADCGHAHVSEKNNIAFTPFGLDVLPKLGKAFQQVQALLEQEKKRENTFQAEFLRTQKTRPDTRVGKLIRTLKPDLDPVELEKLAGLRDDEVKRMEELQVALANDPRKAADAVQTRARRITALNEIVGQAALALGDTGLDSLKALALDHATKKQAADIAAGELFVGEPLPDVGGPVWRQLWEAARRYSTENAYPGQPFPVSQEGARCVLCQQILEPEAMERMQRFEEFVRDDTASKAAGAKEAFDAVFHKTDNLRMHESVVKELLEELAGADATVCQTARAVLAGLKWRYRWVARAARENAWDRKRPAFLDVGSALTNLVATLEKCAAEIGAASTPGERAKLTAEFAELQDRQWLGTVVGDVKTEIDRRKRLGMLDRCLADTRTTTVTTKSKALAKEHVTDQLRRAFAEEVKAMQQGVSRLAIELVPTSAEYGTSLYRVQLVGASQTPVDRVASEGEHRCIALAGFLAELATQQAKSCIVFDDPVTSLDHRWRQSFARRLVQEAKVRQVVVFTHDIVFLHDLLDQAALCGLERHTRRVEAEKDRAGIVNGSLPWVAMKTTERLDALEKEGRAAKKVFEAGGDDAYEQKVAKIYSELRATIERAIEERLFRGIVLRFRDYINPSNLHEVAALTSVDCERLQALHKRCCEVTEAHDHATLRSFGVPNPKEIEDDIEHLRDLLEDLRKRQIALAK
jgi:hypothetical protein